MENLLILIHYSNTELKLIKILKIRLKKKLKKIRKYLNKIIQYHKELNINEFKSILDDKIEINLFDGDGGNSINSGNFFNILYYF